MRSARPKVLHPVLGEPVLGHVLRAVEATGARPITVVTGHQAELVEAAFSDRALSFVRQDPPRGTGHAVQVCRSSFERRPEQVLLVVNGDLPLLRGQTLRKLLEVHGNRRGAATLLTAVLPDGGSYGRVLREAEGGRVLRIVEARDATAAEKDCREINAGIYAFHVPSLLTVLGELRSQNAQGEFYITDLVALLVAAGHDVHAVAVPDAAEVAGVNNHAELADAAGQLRARTIHDLMEKGVRVEDPGTVHVGLDVVVEADAVLRPFTILEGRTIVRANATVGPFARVTDSEIGQGAAVLDHCVVNGCVIGPEASIGPFAHLRPESRVGIKARVGNFVELKKTVLGDGSKAPHLSYLGDATIGPSVNLGAGTITCNYDGHAKHPTRIESGAFVGSDSTLVAPVTIGEGAYVGAGSVITEDVPANSLALGRSRQVIKEGWAGRRAPKKAHR